MPTSRRLPRSSVECHMQAATRNMLDSRATEPEGMVPMPPSGVSGDRLPMVKSWKTLPICLDHELDQDEHRKHEAQDAVMPLLMDQDSQHSRDDQGRNGVPDGGECVHQCHERVPATCCELFDD